MFVTVLGLFCAWLPSRPAAAADLRRNEARELYQKGMRHYELGEYDTAIIEFKASYELSAAPGLLFNLGQVYRVKNDYPQALRFYRTYLRLQPKAVNRTDVEGLIAELEAAQAHAARAPKSEPPPPPSSTAPRPALAPPPPAGVAPPPPPPPTRRAWRAELWAGGALAVAGVGALAAAIGLGVVAQSNADQLARASAAGDQTWTAARDSLYHDGQRDAAASTALYAVGGVLAATGAAVLYLGFHDRHRERALAWAPRPDGMGLAWRY